MDASELLLGLALGGLGLFVALRVTEKAAAAPSAVAPAPVRPAQSQPNGLTAIGGFLKATATGGPVGGAVYWGQQFIATQANPSVRSAEVGAFTSAASSTASAAGGLVSSLGGLL